jgi:hypothetical protein
VRNLLVELADNDGRNEGAEIEQIILFYAAFKSLMAENVPITIADIEARKARIWQETLDKNASEGDE